MSKVGDILLIMKDASQIAVDLGKYQLHQLSVLYRETLTKVVAWALIILTSILLAISGIGMLVWAVYRQLSLLLGPVGSAYILGGFLILLAVIIFLVGRNTLRD